MSIIRRKNNSPTWSHFVNDFLDRDWLDWTTRNFSDTNTTLPSVNIKESHNGFEVDIAAPGFEKKDFKIELNHGVLTISSGKKVENETKEGQQFTKREFSYQSFTRSFTLPDTVDSDKISAKYDMGILKMAIPKKEEAKVKPSKMIKIM
jgi:HSP20 family protein